MRKCVVHDIVFVGHVEWQNDLVFGRQSPLFGFVGPLLLTQIDFNFNMDKKSHTH